MCALCIVLTQLFFFSNRKGFFAETVHQNKYCGETEELTGFRHFFKTCNPLFPFRAGISNMILRLRQIHKPL